MADSKTSSDNAGNITAPAPAPAGDPVQALLQGLARMNAGNVAASYEATPGLSETIPGGKYLVKGPNKDVPDRWFNANGVEINENGKLKDPEKGDGSVI